MSKFALSAVLCTVLRWVSAGAPMIKIGRAVCTELAPGILNILVGLISRIEAGHFAVTCIFHIRHFDLIWETMNWQLQSTQYTFIFNWELIMTTYTLHCLHSRHPWIATRYHHLLIKGSSRSVFTCGIVNDSCNMETPWVYLVSSRSDLCPTVITANLCAISCYNSPCCIENRLSNTRNYHLLFLKGYELHTKFTVPW